MAAAEVRVLRREWTLNLPTCVKALAFLVAFKSFSCLAVAKPGGGASESVVERASWCPFHPSLRFYYLESTSIHRISCLLFKMQLKKSQRAHSAN